MSLRIFWLASSREGRGRDSHEKGPEFVVILSKNNDLQLHILGTSDYRVQIACALLLRRVRSIRSLPQDAIGRSVVDAYSLSVGSKVEFLWREHMEVLPHSSTQKIRWVLTVPYSPFQR